MAVAVRGAGALGAGSQKVRRPKVAASFVKDQSLVLSDEILGIKLWMVRFISSSQTLRLFAKSWYLRLSSLCVTL